MYQYMLSPPKALMFVPLRALCCNIRRLTGLSTGDLRFGRISWPMSCYVGTLCHTPRLGALEILHDHAILVDDKGYVSGVHPREHQTVRDFVEAHPGSTTIIPEHTFLIPTFVDLHLHAPQFTFLGNGLHLPLMQWLDEYAYRAEEMLDADPSLARMVYSRLAHRLVEYGTGAVLLFGTIKEQTKYAPPSCLSSRG